MHYRNGREAKNGDRIIKLDWNGKPEGGAILFDAVAGNDYCNGSSATVQTGSGVCLVDALHVDDVAAILAEKGLDKRPTAAESLRACGIGPDVQPPAMMNRRWPVVYRSDEMTEASEHVFQDAGRWWFEAEDESSNGPYLTVDAADDAFKAYCNEVLGPKKVTRDDVDEHEWIGLK